MNTSREPIEVKANLAESRQRRSSASWKMIRATT
jgi:hypothetical protein